MKVLSQYRLDLCVCSLCLANLSQGQAGSMEACLTNLLLLGTLDGLDALVIKKPWFGIESADSEAIPTGRKTRDVATSWDRGRRRINHGVHHDCHVPRTLRHWANRVEPWRQRD
jgi:hypothetical protein